MPRTASFKESSLGLKKKSSAQAGQVVFVAGTQWGDEGKGKLVDILASEFDLVARAAGGANAGHTIRVRKEDGTDSRHVFHLLPSGVLHPKVINVIGNGTVVHVPTLLEELGHLKAAGISVKGRLLVSDRAHLVFDYHKKIDALQEERKGDRRVGTTKRGIGPAYADKVGRQGLRMCDLLHFDHFASLLRQNATEAMRVYGFDFDIETEINRHKDAVELLEPMICNTLEVLDKALKAGKRVLVEGANAAHLDIDFGTYPYVTSSNTTAAGACTGLGLAPNRINQVIGITKAYTTRVGEGPFPTELASMEGDMLREQGNEYGSTTGRPRRCGWFDAVVVKNAITLNGIESLNLTKLDVLTGFKEIKVGTGYKLDGEPIVFVPAALADFERVEVDYITLPGWDQDLSGAKTFKDLPKAARAYVEKLEALVGVPIRFIGTGALRDQMITR